MSGYESIQLSKRPVIKAQCMHNLISKLNKKLQKVQKILKLPKDGKNKKKDCYSNNKTDRSSQTVKKQAGILRFA